MIKNYQLKFSKESLLDAKEALDWYNLQQENLGERFKIELNFTIEKISKSPLNYQIKYGTIRTANFKVFPFAIHFELDEKASLIRIISIFHFSRKPYWNK
jgi:hypothetical protein